MTMNDSFNRVGRTIMTKKLVPEKISQPRLMKLILELTRSDDFIFLLAQK